MLVFDTSAYLNGRRDHYPPTTFPSVWDLVAGAMTDGRIITPREVYRELIAKDDEITAWCKQLPPHVFVDPIEPVQRRVGIVYAQFANPGRRDGADPFVIAEAQHRGFMVVTPTRAAASAGFRRATGIERCPASVSIWRSRAAPFLRPSQR